MATLYHISVSVLAPLMLMVYNIVMYIKVRRAYLTDVGNVIEFLKLEREDKSSRLQEVV